MAGKPGDLTERFVSGELVYDGGLLKVRRDVVELPDGQNAYREYIRHPGACAILPLFDDGRILLERQFRYPHGRDFIELPAGKLEPGEPHLETAKRELLEETGPLDALLVPCGGAGLLSGCAVAAKHLAPRIRVIGVEPAAGNDVTLSFQQKKIVRIDVPDTIADGARTQAPGDVTFPLVLRYVDEMATVPDDALLRAMFYLWEKLRTVVEPTGALAACALFEKPASFAGQRVGVVLSGGNVDLRWAAETLVSRS